VSTQPVSAGPSRGARVVVTGGQGFIGRGVVRLLVEAGAEVVAPYRPDGGVLADLPAEQAPVDLRDASKVDEVLRGASGANWASPNTDSAADLMRAAPRPPSRGRPQAPARHRRRPRGRLPQGYAQRLDARLRSVGVRRS